MEWERLQINLIMHIYIRPAQAEVQSSPPPRRGVTFGPLYVRVHCVHTSSRFLLSPPEEQQSSQPRLSLVRRHWMDSSSNTSFSPRRAHLPLEAPAQNAYSHAHFLRPSQGSVNCASCAHLSSRPRLRRPRWCVVVRMRNAWKSASDVGGTGWRVVDYAGSSHTPTCPPRALTYDVVSALKHPCTLEARATFSLPLFPPKDFVVQATMD